MSIITVFVALNRLQKILKRCRKKKANPEHKMLWKSSTNKNLLLQRWTQSIILQLKKLKLWAFCNTLTSVTLTLRELLIRSNVKPFAFIFPPKWKYLFPNYHDLGTFSTENTGKTVPYCDVSLALIDPQGQKRAHISSRLYLICRCVIFHKEPNDAIHNPPPHNLRHCGHLLMTIKGHLTLFFYTIMWVYLNVTNP